MVEDLGVIDVELEPGQAEIVERAHDLEIPLGLEIEVEVEVNADVRPGALAQRLELIAQGGDDVAVGVERGARRPDTEPRHV